VQRYKVEPYGVAADVSSNPRHIGRGGWTWYSGSAGWMQRAGVESILGLRLQGKFLHLDPCIPKTWPRFEMTIRHRSARYQIEVENPDGVGHGVASADLDGAPIAAGPLLVPLADDGITHRLRVRLG
jgi:cyclic beta-1,2-glucan synthetase